MFLNNIYFLLVAGIMLRLSWNVSMRAYDNYKRAAFFSILYFALFVASLNFVFHGG